MKMFQNLNIVSYRSSLLVGIVSILLAATTPTDAAMWVYEWDAVTETPESEGLTFSGTNPNSPTVDGLEIPDTGFYTGSFDGDDSPGWTVAFRIRRVDTSAAYGAMFSVNDGTNLVQFDYFANTNFRMNTSTGLQYIGAPGGDNRNFTDIQISLFEGSVNIYVDGNDTPVLSYTAVANAGAAKILLGNYSVGTPVTEITYLNWTDEGAFVPSAIPEPSSLLLLGSGALVLFGSRRCRRFRVS